MLSTFCIINSLKKMIIFTVNSNVCYSQFIEPVAKCSLDFSLTFLSFAQSHSHVVMYNTCVVLDCCNVY